MSKPREFVLIDDGNWQIWYGKEENIKQFGMEAKYHVIEKSAYAEMLHIATSAQAKLLSNVGNSGLYKSKCEKLQASNKAIKQLADEMAGALNNIRSCTNDLNPQRKIFFKANEVLTKYNAFKERDNG